MNIAQIQQVLGLAFGDQGLLGKALTHPSYVNEHPEDANGSNQRLEFLGDAFIGLVVARALYRSYPDLDEGLLTELRAQVVQGLSLAGAARRLNIGQYLLLGQGEAASGGRNRDSNLAAALEALVGAVLLDRGYRAAQSFVLDVLRPDLKRVGPGVILNAPKSRLQELTQRMSKGTPSYQVIGTEGPAHQRSFTVQVLVNGTVMGTGIGRRKADAERQAALEALRRME